MALVPVVFEEAAAGDEVARAIIEADASRFADAVRTTAARLGLEAPYALVLAGGVLRHPAAPCTPTRSRAGVPDAVAVRATWEPAAGALLLACDEVGFDPYPARLRESAAGGAFFATALGPVARTEGVPHPKCRAGVRTVPSPRTDRADVARSARLPRGNVLGSDPITRELWGQTPHFKGARKRAEAYDGVRVVTCSSRTRSLPSDGSKGSPAGPTGTCSAATTPGRSSRSIPTGRRDAGGRDRRLGLGLACDGTGHLFVCTSGPEAVVRLDLESGASGTPGASPPPAALPLPNYPVFAPDGTLYVSDSGPETPGALSGRVVAVPPGGGEATVVADGFDFANGLALAPDGTLYVVESYDTPGVTALSLADGSRRRFADLPRDRPGRDRAVRRRRAAGVAASSRTRSTASRRAAARPSWCSTTGAGCRR